MLKELLQEEFSESAYFEAIDKVAKYVLEMAKQDASDEEDMKDRAEEYAAEAAEDIKRAVKEKVK